MAIDNKTCPRCGTHGQLAATLVLLTAPIGSHSLAGARFKVSAREAVKLTCGACDLVGYGQIEGGQMVFPRLVAAGAR